jgi:hypothetical protein
MRVKSLPRGTTDEAEYDLHARNPDHLGDIADFIIAVHCHIEEYIIHSVGEKDFKHADARDADPTLH